MVQSNKFVGFCARFIYECFLAHEFHEFHEFIALHYNGDLIGRTNFH